MAAITAVTVSVAPPSLQNGNPVVYIVSSSAAVYFWNWNTTVWSPLPMVTT